MNKDKLLRRLLTRIREHGYYHQIDMALVAWFLDGHSTKGIAERYQVTLDALYKQKERLIRQEASE